VAGVLRVKRRDGVPSSYTEHLIAKHTITDGYTKGFAKESLLPAAALSSVLAAQHQIHILLCTADGPRHTQLLPCTLQATTYHTPHTAPVNQRTKRLSLPAGRGGSTKSPVRCGGGSRSRTTVAGCVATHSRKVKSLLTRQRRSKNSDLTNKRRDYKWLKSWAVDSHTGPAVSTLRILPAHTTYNRGASHRSTVPHRTARCADTKPYENNIHTPQPQRPIPNATSSPVEIGDGVRQHLELVAAEGQHLQVDQGVQVGGQCGDPILPVYTAFSVLFHEVFSYTRTLG
jgi:hypothetical protein